MPLRLPRLRSPSTANTPWRLEMGANVVDTGGVRFRVWAPDAGSADVQLGESYVPMQRDGDGVWEATVPSARAGDRYRYRIDGSGEFPDPYSRYQPEGPHGPSQVVDPDAHSWADAGWRGLKREGLVVYECHVGVHTPEGTFDALIGDLDALAGLGVNAIELMPVADFPGERNWGYDGVNMFAPSRNYGGPDALKRLVDAAHARGIGVILDVVYNHFGPDGNYTLQFSRDYLTARYKTPWGDAVNYDGPNSAQVRRYAIDNARYWVNEYHADGLRVDATFAVHDSSPRHILAELTAAVRDSTDRAVVMIAETYENDRRYVRAESEGGLGFDAQWSDDFHHVVHSAASRERSGYYRDYEGTDDELARTINHGWLFEGQLSEHLGSERGTPARDLPAPVFVYFLENHDQVGNRAFGRRLAHLIGAGEKRPWSALHMLLPYTPLIFAGEEFSASSRFFYFTDHHEDLGRAVTEGRRQEHARMAASAGAELMDIPDPQAVETFQASKLRLEERAEGIGRQTWEMYGELLRLRRADPVIARQDRFAMRAIPASEQLLLVHLWHRDEQRLIVVNTGVAVDAPPDACGIPDELRTPAWRVLFSTDDRRFGGTDDRVRFDPSLVQLPPRSTVLLAATVSATRPGGDARSVFGRLSDLLSRRRPG